MKAFINANTGKGKTCLCVYLARLYNYLNPNNRIYANFKLNIPNSVYSRFLFLPFSTIEKGNCLLIFDDFYALRNVEQYTSILAVLSRKVNVEILITIQYYTMVKKELRNLCHFEIIPHLTDIQNKKLTNTSKLIIEMYNPITEQLISIRQINDILKLINGYYDTNEIVKFPSERNIIQEIAQFSNDLSDVEFNTSLYTKNQATKKRVVKSVCELKNIKN